MVEPTIVVQPNAPLPNVAFVNFGNPTGVNGPPSNGTGSGGGIGSGKGGGVGSGDGVDSDRAAVPVSAAGSTDRRRSFRPVVLSRKSLSTRKRHARLNFKALLR